MERRRELAFALLQQGHTQAEVARQLGVDARSVRRWTQAIRVGGPTALRAIPASGRPPKLTEEQRQELQQQLLQGALAAGFSSDDWTCQRVADLIARHFGVHYHVTHVGRLLHAMNWSSDRPARATAEIPQSRLGQWLKGVFSTIRRSRTE